MSNFTVHIDLPCTAPELERVITALMDREDSDDHLIVDASGYRLTITRRTPERSEVGS